MKTPHDQTSIDLARSYLEILSATDLTKIFNESPHLSGLFLPSVPLNFMEARYRIMVVGMETKEWRNKSCPFKSGKASTLEAIMHSMAVHREFLGRPAGRHRFIQFLDQVKKKASVLLPDTHLAITWSNLFCVSNAGSTPTRALSFDAIKRLSTNILRAQIDVIVPDVIIFTTGVGYDSYLRDYFPDRTESVVLEPRCLWQFQLGRAVCYRTSHPRYAAHNRWRSEALALAFRHLDSHAR